MALTAKVLRDILGHLKVTNRPLSYSVPQRYTDQEIDTLLGGGTGGTGAGNVNNIVTAIDDQDVTINFHAGDQVYAEYYLMLDLGTLAQPFLNFTLNLSGDGSYDYANTILEVFDPIGNTWQTFTNPAPFINYNQNGLANGVYILKITVVISNSSGDNGLSIIWDQPTNDYNPAAHISLKAGSKVSYMTVATPI